jgi:hypothetical protein
MITPIQSVSVKVNKTVAGKLNSDSDILELRGGDYPGRKNVEWNNYGAMNADTPSYGTTQAFKLPTQPTQEQQVRIYLDYNFDPPIQGGVNLVSILIGASIYNSAGQLVEVKNSGSFPYSLSGVKNAVVKSIQKFIIGSSFLDGTDTNNDPWIDVEIRFFNAPYKLVIEDAIFPGDPTQIPVTGSRRVELLQEAVSISGTGPFRMIGSLDIMGVTFIGATTETRDREKGASIKQIRRGPSGNIELVFSTQHRLVDGETMLVANVTDGDLSLINGVWNATVGSNTTVASLAGSVYPSAAPNTVNVSGPFIYKYGYNLGLIGVQQYDSNNDTYSFTTLLKAKGWNWNTLHQLDITGELNNQGYLLKMTDDYNQPQTFSYNGDFMENGAIKAINPKGLYAYNTMAVETKNIINSVSVDIRLLPQIQSGGSIPPGNNAYAVKFLTDNFAESQVSLLTDQIPTFEPLYSSEDSKIYGSVAPATTTKKNRIIVEGITPGVYKYIELIWFKWVSGEDGKTSSVAETIRREVLADNQTSITLEHNGNETAKVPFTIGNANYTGVDVLRAGSNVLNENRLVYGKITTSSEIDIREWVETFDYRIKYNRVRASADKKTYYEFYDPNQTKASYQVFEWYRFRICGRLKSTGAITKAFFAFDVRFVSQDDYNSNKDYQFLDTNKRKRRVTDQKDEMINYDFNYVDSDQILYFNQLGIEVTGIGGKGVDWGFLIDGVPARELFSEILICADSRVDEVIAMGAYYLGSFVSPVGDPPGFIKDPDRGIYELSQLYADNKYSGRSVDSYRLNVTGPNPQFQENSLDTPSALDFSIGSFYSPDLIFGTSFYEGNIPGDQLVVFTSYVSAGRENGRSGNNTDDLLRAIKSSWRSTNSNSKLFISEIVDSVLIRSSSIETVKGANKNYRYAKGSVPYSYFDPTSSYDHFNGRQLSSPVISLKTPIPQTQNPTFLNNSTGIYPSLVFRRRDEKYGSIDSANEIYWQGSSIKDGESSGLCFGGDVFCQSTWTKRAFPYKYEGVYIPATGSEKNTYYAGVKYYIAGEGFNIVSMNRTNTNLRLWDKNNNTQLIYPLSTDDYRAWIGANAFDYISQNASYQKNSNVQTQTVFDPNAATNSLAYTRKIYSQLRPVNSYVDKYRQFEPFDFQDNPNTFGSIVDLKVVNGELYTVQERGYTREFFNAKGRLQTIEDGDVNVGDGSVLSRPGVRLTMIGSKHKWSVCKGFNPSGREMVVWYNSEFKAFMRFGADGTVNLSEREGYSTFFATHSKYIQDKFTPANNQGICAVWDNIGRNFIMTARGWKDVKKWARAESYNKGAEVSFGEEWGIPQIYVATTGSKSSSPANNPSDWEKISFENTDYYSVWTVVFNSQKDTFTHHYGFYPRIYLNNANRYFAPIQESGLEDFIHRLRDEKGKILNFFGKDQEGYSDYVINYQPSLLKKFVAISYTSLESPYRVEMFTQFISRNGIEDRQTYLEASDFNMRENASFSPIKNTLDAQGKNDGPTAGMKGLYLKIRTFFQPGVWQKINDTIVLVRFSQRNNQNP